MKLVINSLIEQTLVTIEQLNFRLTSFDYGLLRKLLLMVGGLVPEGNQHWDLLLSLLSCMELIFSVCTDTRGRGVSAVSNSGTPCLYLDLYPDSCLKLKHNFMLHHPGARFWLHVLLLTSRCQ